VLGVPLSLSSPVKSLGFRSRLPEATSSVDSSRGRATRPLSTEEKSSSDASGLLLLFLFLFIRLLSCDCVCFAFHAVSCEVMRKYIERKRERERERERQREIIDKTLRPAIVRYLWRMSNLFLILEKSYSKESFEKFCALTKCLSLNARKLLCCLEMRATIEISRSLYVPCKFYDWNIDDVFCKSGVRKTR